MRFIFEFPHDLVSLAILFLFFQKKKHVFNYLGMVCALINIGDFGLIVWAHHMCTVSLSLNLH